MKLPGLTLAVLALLIVACSSDAANTPSSDDIEQIIVSTRTPVPAPSSSTPVPTSTPPAASATPDPTPTSAPEPIIESAPASEPDHEHEPGTPEHGHGQIAVNVEVIPDWVPGAFQAPTIPTDRFDLSQLDAAATEAKLIELVSEGWVLYGLLSIFNPRESIGADLEALASLATTPAEVIRLGYPELTFFETWMAVEPTGGSISLNYELAADGTLLNFPVRLENSAAVVDIASGTVLDPVLVLVDPNLDAIEVISSQFAIVIGDQEAGGDESELLGRPSRAFGDALEYQLANPFIFHQILEQQAPDGSVVLLSELRTVDFAIMPPGSMPEVSVWPPN